MKVIFNPAPIYIYIYDVAQNLPSRISKANCAIKALGKMQLSGENRGKKDWTSVLCTTYIVQQTGEMREKS